MFFKKSLLFVSAFCLSCVAVFAQTQQIPWDETDLNVLKTFAENNPKNIYGKMLVAFHGKTADNITYEQFKETCRKLNPYITQGGAIPFFIAREKRFESFENLLLKDPDFNTNYVIAWTIPRKLHKDPEQFRNLSMVENRYTKLSKRDTKQFNNWFRTYKKHSDSYTNEQIKEDMGKLKRFVYPLIQDENWKSVLVQIELYLKSIE